jgi:hypothetical protein
MELQDLMFALLGFSLALVLFLLFNLFGMGIFTYSLPLYVGSM